MNSLVIPIYKNEGSITPLLKAIAAIQQQLDSPFEAVFVVDGSPDRSLLILREELPNAPFKSQLISLSRNFGAFAAIRQGIQAARGDNLAIMAADLQEPPELAVEFFERLESGGSDVVVGIRDGREDPLLSRLASSLFWRSYKRLVNPEIPVGGVDVFGCNRHFREHLLGLEEQNSSLIGLLFWLGFRRSVVTYERRKRLSGKSAWTARRKIKYMFDSVFSFTDLPIRLLLLVGSVGVAASVGFGLLVLVLRLLGHIQIPGYTATIITIIFFSALNMLGFGIVGSYVWRSFTNTQRRPLSIVMHHETFYDLGESQ